MAKIFLSHNSAQKDLVEQVANAIGRDFVYLDKYNFTEGNLLESEIEDKISNSDIFVLFLSDEALNSKWVQKEITFVRDFVDDGKITFLPIVIDQTIVPAKDERIPKWVKKYLMNFIGETQLIIRNIQQHIRMLSWETTHESLFKSKVMIGRDADLDELSSGFFRTIGNTPRAIIVSGMPHSGRKRLLYEMLMRKIVPGHMKTYLPIVVSLSENNSIEYLITQLNAYLEYKKDIYEIMSQGKEACCELCVSMLNDLAEKKEHVFIIDNGSIVLNNGTLSDWFSDIINNIHLKKQNHFYIASQNTPSWNTEHLSEYEKLILCHKINVLSKNYVKALFNSYALELDLTDLNVNDVDFFLSQVNGSPELVITILDDIKKSGVSRIKREIGGIVGMHDRYEYLPIWESFQKNRNTRNILLTLSKFEFVNYDILCEIFPDIPLEECLNEIECSSLLEIFGPNNQFIRLNPLFADFIVRSKYEMDAETTIRVNEYTKKVIRNVDNISGDLAEQLYKIKEAIKNPNVQIDNKYLLPSVALNVLVEEYRAEHYKSVITIARKIIYDAKIEKYETVERAIHYWLCLAYCKKGDVRKLQEEVDYFYDKSLYTFYFLKGYSCRQKGQKYFEEAIKFYKQALQHSKHVSSSYLSKAEHELVITQMRLGEYNGALTLAKKCYEKKPNNPYFEETYARCILRASHPNEETFNELISHMENSTDARKQAVREILKAEAIFYIHQDFSQATIKLRKLIDELPKQWRRFAIDALKAMCDKQEVQNVYRDYKEDIIAMQEELYDDIIDQDF